MPPAPNDPSRGRSNVQDGRVKDAEALLEPLRTRKRYHVTEFAALAGAWIEILVAQKNLEGARSWLQLAEKIGPENPVIRMWRARLSPASGLMRFLGLRR
jgi:hypothetical protein